MKSSIQMVIIRRSLPVFLVLSMAFGGCRRGPCDDGLEEGERFRVTVLGDLSAGSPCEAHVPVLAPGDSFTLAAGPAVMNTVGYGDGETGVCVVHGAAVDGPPFLPGTLTSCATDDMHVLGFTCTGGDASGCALSVTVRINSDIPAGAAVIEHGALWMTWIDGCEAGSCPELYDVRIERVDTLPGG